MRRSAALLAGAALLLGLAGCDRLSGTREGDRPEATDFPRADRPISPIVSTRWSDEISRDRQNEARDTMDLAGVRPGMTVADIGAGEGYYTVRLAERVGARGRVLAQDIVPETIDALARRITRENWANVSVKLGRPDDPMLPAGSFDRIFMVHMYHEIEEPYAFLWHLFPALRTQGEVVVIEANRATSEHGTPPRLLECEFKSVGYRLIELLPKPAAGGYIARFAKIAARPDPDAIRPCALAK